MKTPGHFSTAINTDGFGQLALSADLAEPGVQIEPEILDDHAAAFGALDAALLRGTAAHLILDGIEHGDPTQDLGRDRNWRLDHRICAEHGTSRRQG